MTFAARTTTDVAEATPANAPWTDVAEGVPRAGRGDAGRSREAHRCAVPAVERHRARPPSRQCRHRHSTRGAHADGRRILSETPERLGSLVRAAFSADSYQGQTTR